MMLSALSPCYAENLPLIVIGSSNQVPVAVSQSVLLAEDTSIVIHFTASDPEGDPLTYRVSQPFHGDLNGEGGSLIGGSADIVYHPDTNYFGEDNFLFFVSDSSASTLVNINITVTPSPDPPFALINILRSAGFVGFTNPVVITSDCNQNGNIVFDGSLPSDPDNDLLSFTWMEDTNILAFSPVMTNSLISGIHTLTLSVNDGTYSNSAISTFQVITPCEAIASIETVLETALLPLKRKKSAALSLQVVKLALSKNRNHRARKYLQRFQHEVSSHIAPVDSGLAEVLIKAAKTLTEESDK
jgi:hypothetical protein